MKIVGFLQNVWSPAYAGGTWPREWWLDALHACRSGQRLKIFKELDIYYDNTTPIVGETPDSVVPPDLNHIMRVIQEQQPELIITFGKQAEKAVVKVWDGKLCCLPHPACRVVTNELYREALASIKGYFSVCENSNQIRMKNVKNGSTQCIWLKDEK